MMNINIDATLWSILFAALIGFNHAFEADHLLAVSSIVSKRSHVIHALKDGVFWGLGHASTLLLFGVVIIVYRQSVEESMFSLFEAAVGAALITLGGTRLFQIIAQRGDLKLSHVHTENISSNKEQRATDHRLTYGIGLVHGLAGSGAVALAALAKTSGTLQGVMYIAIFGLGSIAGMLIAVSLFCIPFFGKLERSKQSVGLARVQLFFVIASSMLCISYGVWIIANHIF